MEVKGGKEAGKRRMGKWVSQVHVDIAGPMPIMLDGEREYVYVIVDVRTLVPDVTDNSPNSFAVRST